MWWLVQALLFHPSPQAMYGWRRFLLRLFGAKIGVGVVIRPSASVVYPWRLDIGDHAWIGDDVVLYTFDDIHIGAHSVVSQRSYLCAGSHDYRKIDFPLTAAPIWISDQCWIATDVFISPGIEIGTGTIVAARSTVTRPLQGGVIAMGTPAKVVGIRPANL